QRRGPGQHRHQLRRHRPHRELRRPVRELPRPWPAGQRPPPPGQAARHLRPDRELEPGRDRGRPLRRPDHRLRRRQPVQLEALPQLLRVRGQVHPGGGLRQSAGRRHLEHLGPGVRAFRARRRRAHAVVHRRRPERGLRAPVRPGQVLGQAVGVQHLQPPAPGLGLPGPGVEHRHPRRVLRPRALPAVAALRPAGAGAGVLTTGRRGPDHGRQARIEEQVMLRFLPPAAALAAAFFAAPAVAGATLPGPAQAFVERAVDEAVARYDLPGIAVGVIEAGKVAAVVARGELVAGSGEPVTPEALFKIASNSKAMTAAVLARLVDQGRLRWDDPVVKHLPQFRMHDPWVTANMQVRDLLVHNSGLGLGAGDLMLWPGPNDFTRADIIAGLAHLEPVTSFRSGYAYDNLLYVVAGEVAAAAGGKPYAQLVREEVFAPLGMDGCRVGSWNAGEAGPIARPHRRVDGRNLPAPPERGVVPDITSMAAGGIRCGLEDMLRWVGAWL